MKIKHATYVVMVCTPKYVQRYQEHNPSDPSKVIGVGREVEKIVQRLHDEDTRGAIIPIWRKGGIIL